ncbi:MAG: T9SS type A sorting domain-containing protein, partial [Sphingobacteriales bacterium]
SQLNSSFNYYIVTGSTVQFDNTSSFISVPGANIYNTSSWNFGDGTVSTIANPAHTYAGPGIYTVSLISNWIDSTNNNTLYCSDTSVQQITVTPPPNVISGNISWDSSANISQTSFKVWLITFDSSTNMIDAVDSTIVTGGIWNTTYSFSNHPAGEYRTKAAVLNGAAGANILVPTYHFGSTYWGTASLINHTGGSSAYNDIQMQSGTPTSGPGFIAGNVTLGAGKGTGAGAPHVLILLRDAANQMVRFTYTDVNGDYSFGNVPAGSYNIYPENMPQITTPSSTINLVSGAYNVSGIDFVKNSTEIKPKTTGVNDIVSNLFSIYPNPSNGIIHLNWSNDISAASVSVTVMDITGRQVYKGRAITSAPASINLGNVTSGVYFIRIATGKAQHTERLIIAK